MHIKDPRGPQTHSTKAKKAKAMDVSKSQEPRAPGTPWLLLCVRSAECTSHRRSS